MLKPSGNLEFKDIYFVIDWFIENIDPLKVNHDYTRDIAIMCYQKVLELKKLENKSNEKKTE